jgi:hypothetical protein
MRTERQVGRHDEANIRFLRLKTDQWFYTFQLTVSQLRRKYSIQCFKTVLTIYFMCFNIIKLSTLSKAVGYCLLLLLLLTAIELSLDGSNPYTSADKTNKNKYT